MKNAGIDYGLGMSNVDMLTGCRYGVISIHSLAEWIYDEIQPLYPEDMNEDEECEPIGSELRSAEYVAKAAFDESCLFLTKSPYYTFCKFCSPCAPGAGDLDNPVEDGVKTLCFGPEMFDNEKAPYPVFDVKTDKQLK